ncbi:MAG: Na+/H+ antiporter NhaC, partial [Clostridiales bacterium]|nr:Na+/H+ antiporter NhaC [Clostridiales bacterium]
MKETRLPKLWEALVPAVFMMVLIIVCTVKWGIEPHIPIVVSCAVAALMAYRCGYRWDAIISGILDSIARATEALIIVMIVGMLIGTWVLAGTMPAMVYYGLDLISPSAFLVV